MLIPKELTNITITKNYYKYNLSKFLASVHSTEILSNKRTDAHKHPPQMTLAVKGNNSDIQFFCLEMKIPMNSLTDVPWADMEA